jgi:hypothetical protein
MSIIQIPFGTRLAAPSRWGRSVTAMHSRHAPSGLVTDANTHWRGKSGDVRRLEGLGGGSSWVPIPAVRLHAGGYAGS